MHRRANCTVDLYSNDATFNCEIQPYFPKHIVTFNSLNGDEINDDLNNTKHIHIRGNEIIQAIFEKCKENSNNSLYYLYTSLYVYILLFLLL